jgi:tryptophan 2-monooxygenase
MAFITRAKALNPKAALPPTPANAAKTYIDLLYDFSAYLRGNGKISPGRLDGRSVAIVGSGAAGLIAAYQLMQLGADVSIFEATNRAGGRLYSYHPLPDQPIIFEYGAMRVPPCEQLFNYYCGIFDIKPAGQFPDPGKVQTTIIYRNQAYPWPASGKPPAIFDAVTAGWDALAGKLSGLTQLLTEATPEAFAQARSQWQQLVYTATGLGPERGYSTISFYQALVQAFVENYLDYGLSKPWTGNDFELFGALGVGSGGFGPLYSVNFAEIARLIVNGLESDQQFYPCGVSTLADRFLVSCPDPNRPGVTMGSCVKLLSKVKHVLKTPEKVHIFTDKESTQFDAAIIATTNRSMQIDMNLTDNRVPLISPPVASAVRQLHLMNSSKLFVVTRTKFWQTPGSSLPSNIQSDSLVRGLYCLDYYPDSDSDSEVLPSPGYGVVLISYTWGDDSTKLLAVSDPKERLRILLNSIRSGAPDFVDALEPQIIPELTGMIDWQLEPHYYGAFKLNQPGQDSYNQRLYAQFQSGEGVYLAGDSIGWCGGWIESALQTGMNAASAVVQQCLGSAGLYPNSPMTQDLAQFQYGPALTPEA